MIRAKINYVIIYTKVNRFQLGNMQTYGKLLDIFEEEMLSSKLLLKIYINRSYLYRYTT